MLLATRLWVPANIEAYIETTAGRTHANSADAIERDIMACVAKNRVIHEEACINLNPGTNVPNPKAEAMMACGLGSRPSLGYPGDKYEMGLEGVEKIEIIAAELAAETFGASHAEIRVGSGALANLYVFMMAAKPGDVIIAPPASIGGHVTHHSAGSAGLYGVVTHAAPIDPTNYTVDVEALRADARRLKPKMITVGGSLNLFPHPISQIREIADEVGALVLFDAAHLSGMIAGHAWQQPLEEGAHVMTMSTYKSLGGPAGGLIVTKDPRIAERLDAIAYPGLTANFDAGKSAALAMSLLDWKVHGKAYAKMMTDTAKALGQALVERGLPVFARDRGITASHQFAIEAAPYGGGQTAAKTLRKANILSCGIGLPIDAVAGDMNGLRFGTPEIVRWGMTPKDMPKLAGLVADALTGTQPLAEVAAQVTAWRKTFNKLHYVR